jgi:hypothetical protein
MIFKLTNEVFTDTFCSASKRPNGCSKGMNLCCLFCDDRQLCAERCDKTSVKPCLPKDFEEDEKCEFLI